MASNQEHYLYFRHEIKKMCPYFFTQGPLFNKIHIHNIIKNVIEL